MAKKKVKNKKPSQRWKHYKVEGDKVTRLNPFSPKEGPGTFMAVHKDRVTCGKTGYTEFKKKEVQEESKKHIKKD